MRTPKTTQHISNFGRYVLRINIVNDCCALVVCESDKGSGCFCAQIVLGILLFGPQLHFMDFVLPAFSHFLKTLVFSLPLGLPSTEF